MRFMKFAVLAAVFALPASFANAGVMGSAEIDITSFLITANPAVLPSGTSTGSVSTALNGGLSTFSFDLAGGPVNQTDTDGTSTSSATVTPGGSGSPLVPPGFNIETLSEVDLQAPGSAFAGTSASLGSTFNPDQNIDITFTFDGTATIAQTMGDALGSLGGFTDFNISLTGSGIGIPDGNLLAALNALAQAQLDRTTVGSSGGSFTQSITLQQGGAYQFGVNQVAQVQADLREDQVIPEPTSAVCFGGLLIVGLCSRRKRA